MSTQSVVPMLPGVRRVFRALATTIVPEAAGLDAPGWNELEGIVERALAGRPAAVRRQLAGFLRAVDVLPLLRYGRRFTALDAAQRAAVLHTLQRSRVLAIRRGVWGLRTLVFMGYYSRAAAAGEIGYKADARGWEALR